MQKTQPFWRGGQGDSEQTTMTRKKLLWLKGLSLNRDTMLVWVLIMCFAKVLHVPRLDSPKILG